MRAIYVLIAILLGVNNVFILKRVGFLSYDRLFEILLFFLFLKPYLQELKNNKSFRSYNNYLLVFIVLQLLMNLKMVFFNGMELLQVVKDLFKGGTFIVFSYLFLLILKKDDFYVKILCWAHLLIIMFGLLHHPLSPLSETMQLIKKSLLVSNDPELGAVDLSNEEVYIQNGLASRFRLSGPFAFAITYSYFAFSSFIINLYMYLKTKQKFYLIVLILLVVTAFLCQTRSLILGLFIVIFGLIALQKNKSFGYISTTILLGLIASLILSINIQSLTSLDSRVLSTNKTGGGSDSRPLLWLTGFVTVLENPFGVGKEDYQETKEMMYRYTGNPGILHLSAHNGLVNVGFNYTILGYFIFISLVFFLLKNVSKIESRQYRSLFYLMLVGYLIHSSFHNNFIFNSDYPILMVVMLICYERQKTELKEENNL